jgi:hypothetical protein
VYHVLRNVVGIATNLAQLPVESQAEKAT